MRATLVDLHVDLPVCAQFETSRSSGSSVACGSDDGLDKLPTLLRARVIVLATCESFTLHESALDGSCRLLTSYIPITRWFQELLAV